MFDNLSDRLGNVFDRLRGRGALNEQDVRDAMREVRVALLEADVALPVVRRFIDYSKFRAEAPETRKTPADENSSASVGTQPLWNPNCIRVCRNSASAAVCSPSMAGYRHIRRMVEPSGIEPLTSCMPCRRSPS